MVSFGESLQRARQLLSSGDLAGAEPIYRQLVETSPQEADPWHELGVLQLQAGRPSAAIDCLRRAATLDPGKATYQVNLGTAHRMLRQSTEAIASFQRALQLGPPTAELLNNLALALKDTGQAEAALRAFDEALSLRPKYANGHFNRGNLLCDLGRLEEAAASYRRAIDAQPLDAVAHCKLGVVYHELRGACESGPAAADVAGAQVAAGERKEKLEQAVACFRRALELAPNYAEAYANLAIALAQQSDMAEAAACWQRATELQPNNVEAHGSLGVILEQQNKFAEAIACWQKALELKPDFAEAHNNLGGIYSKQGHFAEAETCWWRALEVQPDFNEAANNLAIQLTQQGRTSEAIERYRQVQRFHPRDEIWNLCMLSACPVVFPSNEAIADYRRNLLGGLEDLARRQPRFEIAQLTTSACTPSFNLAFHGCDERPLREAYASLFHNCFERETPRGSTGRPRIGLVVTDQHEPLFLKSMAGVIDRIDGDLFELVIIGSDAGIVIIRSAIRNQAVELVSVAGKFDQYVAAIRKARLDVLYYWEVGTDSINYFLPYLRLAPVQCTSWGIQVTSGIPQMDYYLSSALVEPDDAREHYTENLVLANTLLTYQERVALAGPPRGRESFGIAADRNVYLCAQQLGKFQPDFDTILAGILRRDPQGVVVTVDDRCGGYISQQLRERFTATMPDVAKRIVFLPFQPNEAYLNLVAAADVLLDPLHFGGVNSTYDGFSLHKPIVTLPSRYHRGRYTLACYKKMGISDCVASTPQQYIDIAVALGTDGAFRREISAKIEQASDVLFADIAAVREHERIFNALVEQARSGNS